MPILDLPNGYYDLPKGKIANIVTFLEMHEPPRRALRNLEARYSLMPLDRSDLPAYRSLYRDVGEDWLWFSRSVMADDALRAILSDPQVEPFALCEADKRLGLLELDFRVEGECELAFFGLVPDAIGQGLGRAMMDEGIGRAWSRPIRRFWVHTCTADSPEALPFYIRSGFTPYARKVEIDDDHRLSGKLPRGAAPHIPIIE